MAVLQHEVPMRLLPFLFVLALGCKTAEECPPCEEPTIDGVIEEPAAETTEEVVPDEEEVSEPAIELEPILE